MGYALTQHSEARRILPISKPADKLSDLTYAQQKSHPLHCGIHGFLDILKQDAA